MRKNYGLEVLDGKQGPGVVKGGVGGFGRGARTALRVAFDTRPVRSRKRKKFRKVDMDRARLLCAIPSATRCARKLRKSAAVSPFRSASDGGAPICAVRKSRKAARSRE